MLTVIIALHVMHSYSTYLSGRDRGCCGTADRRVRCSSLHVLFRSVGDSLVGQYYMLSNRDYEDVSPGRLAMKPFDVCRAALSCRSERCTISRLFPANLAADSRSCGKNRYNASTGRSVLDSLVVKDQQFAYLNMYIEV